MINCSIIGQSNSIIKGGFASRLFDRGDIRIGGNGRMGASPSLICPLFGDSTFFNAAKFCIIDCCIIDYSLIYEHTLSYRDVITWIEWVGHKSRMNGCQPIFVIIPIEYLVRKDDALLRIYMEVIKRSGYYYLDFRDLVDQPILSLSNSGKSLFRDGAHPGDELSQAAADVLATFILNYESIPLSEIVVRTILPRFEIINLRKCLESENEFVDRSNSMFSFSGIKISDSHPAILNVESFDRLHGIVVNAAKSTSHLSIQNGQVTKNLDLLPYGQADFEMRTIPIQRCISAPEGKLSLAIAKLPEQNCEATSRSRKWSGHPGEIEVCDLIVETTCEAFKYESESPTTQTTNIIDLINFL